MKTVNELIGELFKVCKKDLKQFENEHASFKAFLERHGNKEHTIESFSRKVNELSPSGAYLSAAVNDLQTKADPSENFNLFLSGFTHSAPEIIPSADIKTKNILVEFIDATMRGCGQVWFQNNPLTGAVLYAGIFYNSITLGLCTLLGTASSTAFAYILGIPREDIRNGLYGFNGTLAGVAVGFYFNMTPIHWFFLIVIAGFSTVLMAALQTFFSTWSIAPLTAPFVLASWLCFFGVYKFSALSPNELIGPSSILQSGTDLAFNINTYLEGTAKGVGEVMFQDNTVTGLIFLVALAINSRAAFVWAAFSALAAIATASVLGGDETAARLGLFGYSAVLTGIALGSGVFFPVSPSNALLTVFAVVITTIVQATVSIALAPIGMPPLTWPFIIVTWIFLLAAKRYKFS